MNIAQQFTMMYKPKKYRTTTIKSLVDTTEGETIEVRLERFLNNGEPIEDKSIGLIYTERSEGVIPAYNIRTDKWEVALTASDRIAKSIEARRLEKMKPKEEAIEEIDNIEPVEGKN